MRVITTRVILAIVCGALIWQGIVMVANSNYFGLLLVAVGIFLGYKARFW